MSLVCGWELEICSFFWVLEEAIVGEVANKLPEWSISNQSRHCCRCDAVRWDMAIGLRQDALRYPLVGLGLIIGVRGRCEVQQEIMTDYETCEANIFILSSMSLPT